ncbi:MAG: hypothetical protein RBQ71_03680 [Acholeplasmataceae bacterium]|jgi:hypothetical protein|nr:hypothetical protein [Acholeplasmataceae bacterium]
MKKGIIIVFIMMLLTITGCSKYSSLSYHDERLLKKQGYLVEPLTYDNVSFGVEITNIVINVPCRQIQFDYNITSHYITNRYFFAITYEHQERRLFHPVSEINFKLNDHYILDLYYDKDNPTGYVDIEMRIYTSSSTTMGKIPNTLSAGFRYYVHDILDRQSFEYDRMYAEDLESSVIDLYDVSVMILIDDPHEIVHSAKFILIDATNNDIVIDEVELEITPRMRRDSKIIIERYIAFTGLERNIRYQIKLYVSGDDGVYQFRNTYLDSTYILVEDSSWT